MRSVGQGKSHPSIWVKCCNDVFILFEVRSKRALFPEDNTSCAIASARGGATKARPRYIIDVGHPDYYVRHSKVDASIDLQTS